MTFVPYGQFMSSQVPGVQELGLPLGLAPSAQRHMLCGDMMGGHRTDAPEPLRIAAVDGGVIGQAKHLPRPGARRKCPDRASGSLRLATVHRRCPWPGSDTDAVAGRAVICLVLVSQPSNSEGWAGRRDGVRPTPSRLPRTEWSATLVTGPVADRGAAHPSSHPRSRRDRASVSRDMPASGTTTTGAGASGDVIHRGDGRMPAGKTKLLRAIAAHERRQEREARREARRRLRAERRAARHQRPEQG
jgi:hypothetical protein